MNGPDEKRERLSETTIHDLGAGTGAAAGRLYLVVIGDGISTAYPLPGAGEVSIGRGDSCDVLIDHPSISRRHARLHIGPQMTIQDLASANGTRIRGEAVARDVPTPIAVGEAIDLGSILVVVQRRSTLPGPPRLRTHDYFEGRLHDECDRATRGGKGFGVARIHCNPALAVDAVERCVTPALEPGDVLASFATGEYEALLVDADQTALDSRQERLALRLRHLDPSARFGIARFPTDGRSPYELLARARAAAHGLEDGIASDRPVVIDSKMVQLYRMVDRVAAGTISILLLGETGVGKEVVARAVHNASPRREKPFLRLNCAALSETLLESELFGHEKGSFTGATATKPGLLEIAAGGTVFLDEVGELPASIQAKLLRALEEREILRVGGLAPRNIDVRFVAATNRALDAEVARGHFREDLYYRLNGVTLTIPALRERPSEIEALATRFTEQAASEVGRNPAPQISGAALDLLRSYSWPGNIREVRNMMERAVLLCPDDHILPEHLPLEKMRAAKLEAEAGRVASPNVATEIPPVTADAASTAFAAGERSLTLAATDEEERQRIEEALARSAGNQTRAAELLGISRRTLSKRLDRYAFPRPRKKQ